MYQAEIIKSTEPKVTFIWGVMLNKLEPFLKKQNIEYEVIIPKDFEDGWQTYYIFKGRKRNVNVVAIRTCIEPDCLQRITEELHHVNLEDI